MFISIVMLLSCFGIPINFLLMEMGINISPLTLKMQNDFVKILDSYAEKKAVMKSEYMKLIQHINYDYMSNNYSCATVVGDITPPSVKLQTVQQANAYDIWKSKHVVDHTTFEKLTVTPDNESPMIMIDANIQTITDLLKIVEDNPYDSSKRYNIDLKSLHSINDELVKLDNMVGLKNFKESITNQLLYFLQGLHKVGDGDYKHTMIYGSPGTGKTQIAKIIGTMYSKVGILDKNKFKKVTRSDLVAGYLGQTAIKTKDVIQECVGGVLFIDEVYSLGSQVDDDNYSKECIDTLCECLSDNKAKLMVIVAGYEKDIKERFLSRNSGLESRFIWKFEMDKYTYEDLYTIFNRMVVSNGWRVSDDLTDEWFKTNYDKFAAYGRDIEKLFSYCKISHGRRIYGKPDQTRLMLTKDDVDKGLSVFEHNQIKDPSVGIRKEILSTLYA